MSSEIKPIKQSNLTSKISHVAKVMGSITRVSGLLLTVISMHVLVIRPLVDRVDQLQSELHDIDVTLSRVAAEQTHLHATNDLLSELKTQHDEIAGARASLQQMQKLREELEIESNKIPEAMKAVTRLSELPVHLHRSELERYTTLTKPVPNPYQNNLNVAPFLSSKDGSDAHSVEAEIENSPKASKATIPPYLFISGSVEQEGKRYSSKESNRIYR